MKIKRVIIGVLTVVLFMSALSGCKKSNGGGETDIKQTDIVFYKNGVSDYKIVVPKDGLESDSFAAGELNYFFKLATDFSIPIITDEGLSFNSNDKYISLGDTALLNGSGENVDFSSLGKSGYVVKRKGNTVLISGSNQQNSYGTIYGVYSFLNRQIGLEVYSSDEFYLDAQPIIKLYDFDLKELPDFEHRSLGYWALIEDSTYATRMRIVSRGNDEWALWGHTYISNFLPEATYREDNPDWYRGSGRNTVLCLSNKEMREEFIERLKYFIEQSPSATYIGLTQPDNTVFCECDDCKREIQRLGSAGGLNLEFVNYVSAEADKWLAENYPDRKMTYLTFAYHVTEAPPVAKNADGSYSPYCDEVVARDNVIVELCIPGLDFSKGLSDGTNYQYYEKINGWAACVKNLSVYSYCINFWNYFINFNNFTGVEKIYRESYTSGANSVHENGPLEERVTCFEEMRLYVQSKLMWDTSLHYDDLVNEFMDNYYKGAAKHIREYYDLLNIHFTVLEKEKNLTATIYYILESSSLWPKELLLEFKDIFADAYTAIEPLKTEDGQLYNKLFNRIKKEELSIDFMLLQMYSAYYTKSELSDMITQFKYYANKFNLLHSSEATLIDGVYEKWDSKIS